MSVYEAMTLNVEHSGRPAWHSPTGLGHTGVPPGRAVLGFMPDRRPRHSPTGYFPCRPGPKGPSHSLCRASQWPISSQQREREGEGRETPDLATPPQAAGVHSTGKGQAGKTAGWSRASVAEAKSMVAALHVAREGSLCHAEAWSGDGNDWVPCDVEEWRRSATELVEAAGSADELV